MRAAGQDNIWGAIDRTPDVTWLFGDSAFDAHVISAGERLPFGIEVFSGRQPNDLLLWVESRQAAGASRSGRAVRPLTEAGA